MVVAALLDGIGSIAANAFARNSPSPALLPFVLIEALPLWWRRRNPMLVLALVAGSETTKWALGLDSEPSGTPLVFAVYAVSVYGRRSERLAVAGIAIAIIVFAVALLLFGQFPAARILIPSGALSLVAWVIGDYIRARRQFFTDLMVRNRQEREQAAEEERLRIARELHDVVAHNVSVMAIQAGAARVSGSSSAEALASIEQSARDTLAELNKLLGVLRKSPTSSAVPGAPDRTPQPTLDDIDALLKPVRDAGLAATLRVVGEKRPVSVAIDLSAYRIVQEAITNVLKHANASRVEVLIDYQPDALGLTISDNGSGPQEANSDGHGLIGMRERVALFGGEMETGTSPLGGFTVRAWLPLQS